MFGNKEQQQFVALQERTDQVRTFIADSPSKTATSTDSASLIDSVGKYLKLAPELTINPPDLVDVVLREASDSFDEYAAIKANRDQLKARKIKVHPGQQEAYAARIAELEAKINGAWKVTEAIKRGYEPYTVPNTLYVGTMSRKEAIEMRGDWADRAERGNNISSFFNAPMPVEVLEKLYEAQKSMLFGRFVVASADKSLFTELPAPLFVEPVLVGFIETGNRGLVLRQNDNIVKTSGPSREPLRISPGLAVQRGVGFLIAHWDLARDLRQNPNQ